jgi:hypothetical protein
MNIRISSFTAVIECPHCGAAITGWLCDPRGVENVECDECEKTFDVPSDTEVILD